MTKTIKEPLLFDMEEELAVPSTFFWHLGERYCPECGKPTYFIPSLNPHTVIEHCTVCRWFFTLSEPSFEPKKTKHNSYVSKKHPGFEVLL